MPDFIIENIWKTAFWFVDDALRYMPPCSTIVFTSNCGGFMMVFFTAHWSATFVRAWWYFSGKAGGTTISITIFSSTVFPSSVFHIRRAESEKYARRNFALLAETKYINACARSYWCKKMFIGRWCRPFATILNRLVSINGKAIEHRINFLSARESNFDFYCPLLWCSDCIRLRSFCLFQ